MFSPNLANRNTVVRAIRLDSSLDKMASEAAREKGLSFNLLVNQLLTKYCEYERVAEKLGFVELQSITLKNMLNLISNEESEMLGSTSGFSGQNARQLISMITGKSDLEAFLETLRLMERNTRAFTADISHKNEEYQIIMSHNLGMKWSYFLKGMISSTLEDAYHEEPSFEVTEIFITVRFHRRRELLEQTA
jgi:Holliday junction resolvasome RuvABC DNA-binding subunit